MGIAPSGDGATSTEQLGPEETEDDEEESVVHHTASIGDVEVRYDISFEEHILVVFVVCLSLVLIKTLRNKKPTRLIS